VSVAQPATAGDGLGPAVSVVIPHYNDLANLDRCLDLLARQDFLLPFETIVVDNASKLPLEDIAAVVGNRATLIECGKKGAGPARNAGIAVARASVFAFIDSDCRPEPNWLAAGHAALERWDFVGGHVKVDVDDPTQLTPVEAFEVVFAFRFKYYIEQKRFTGTGNLFAKRAVFDAVGGFKPQVSEDVEWSHRALAGGFTLGFEPAAVVGHPARRNWDELRRKWARMNSEGFVLARTRRGGTIRFLLRSWAVLLSIAPHAVTIARSANLHNWHDRTAAMAVLARLRLFRFVAAHRLAWQAFRTPPNPDA
jgi:glycosyltransferase involved in cell wall biosynthesis